MSDTGTEGRATNGRGDDASETTQPSSSNPARSSDETKSIKLDKYGSGISRTFWIVMGLCLAAIVLGMGRNEAIQYQQAIEQLRALPKFSRAAPAVEEKISAALANEIGLPLVRKIAQAAARQNTVTDEAKLLKEMEYYWIQDGDLAFDFSVAPAELQKKIDQILLNQPYVVKTPRPPADNDELGNAIEDVLRRDAGTSRSLIGANFSCNWANDQCAAELVLKPNSVGENVRRLKFFVSGRTLTTSINPLFVLGFSDTREARSALQISGIRELENELAGKTFDQSLNHLAQRASEKEGSIKVFDITFSGATAFLVLPIAIVGSLGWLLLQLRELGSVPLSRNDIRGEAIEILYEDKVGGMSMCLLIAMLPAGALTLLLRVAPVNRSDVTALLVAAAIASGLLSYFIIRQRVAIRTRAV